MIVEDQGAVVDLLSKPETFGVDGPVDQVTTHISNIFMAGDRVLKLKRAVRYPYLDFSTPEARRLACEAEVRVNRRTAPDLYRGVVPVTRDDDGTLALDGTGTPVDWLVDMERFDGAMLFDRLATDGRLDRRIMEDTAEVIAGFHAAASVTPDHGGRKGMTGNIDAYDGSFAEAPDGTFDPNEVARLIAESTEAAAAVAGVLEQRRKSGRVRHGHGDLHLRNIVLIDGRPTLFDAIEFSDEIASIDVLFDLAFLLMDLEHRDLGDLAAIAFNRYLDTAEGETPAGLAALPLFLSQRAAIRAHVTGAAAASQAGGESTDVTAAARDYLDRAIGYLHPPEPMIVAVGGLSGTGKSSLARRLAPILGAAPGARMVRSDVIRKALAGVHTFDRLNPDAYTPEMGRRTYEMLETSAGEVAAAGHAVIADAVFAKPEERAAIEAVAARAGVPFMGLWLEAPEATRLERGAGRGRDASDADSAVIRGQSDFDPGAITWHRVDAGGDHAAVSWATERLRREHDRHIRKTR